MFFSPRKKKESGTEQQLLTLEIREIVEISDLLIGKIRKKMEQLQAVEKSIDAKLTELKELEASAEAKIQSLHRLARQAAVAGSDDGIERYDLILSLHRNGLSPQQIASNLDLPVGEVDLVLNLHAVPCRS